MGRLTVILPPRAAWMAHPWGQSLQSLLSSAQSIRKPASAYAEVARLMGYAAPPAPAGIRRALSSDDAATAHWLLAEPAYCRADLTDAFVIGLSNRLDLSLEDARGLSQELAEDLPEGASFEVADDGTWFVRLEAAPELECELPETIVGKSLGAAMPTGPDAAAWKKAITSMQITLHQSEINQRRLADNLVAVNALLIWGSGTWPVSPLTSDLQVASTDRSLGWLCEHAGASFVDLRHPDIEVPQAVDVLDLRLADAARIQSVLDNVEGLYRLADEGELDWLIDGEDVLRTRRSRWWQFWR